jgi:sterol desaturase/sphingolipid hydroxylase (fatty acid hydroxylase superfamily)
MMHYALHHSTFESAFWKEMKSHHATHHYHDPENGFGVSSKMWDYVFRTTFNIQKKTHVVGEK